MAHYVPHTDAEIASMLEFMGLGSLDDLWSAIPEALRLAHGLDLAPGASEFDVLADVEAMAGRNRRAGADQPNLCGQVVRDRVTLGHVLGGDPCRVHMCHDSSFAVVAASALRACLDADRVDGAASQAGP